MINPHLVAVNEHYAALDLVFDHCVSITLVALNQASASMYPAAIAAADLVGDFWWVSRVLVGLPEFRGQGLGSLAVQRMLEKIASQSQLPIRVAPGGYTNETEKQFRFYEKNGFKRVEGEPGLLEWRPW